MNWYYSKVEDNVGKVIAVFCQECGAKRPELMVTLGLNWPGYPMTDCEECGREQVIEAHGLVGCGCPACRIARMRQAARLKTE